ncbi:MULTISPECIES: hypothetical protein [Paenibacillus]|nr:MULTISPECIES: hypothetical protein [Paenibacillus]
MKEHLAETEQLQERSIADVQFRTVDDILEYYNAQHRVKEQPSEEQGQ